MKRQILLLVALFSFGFNPLPAQNGMKSFNAPLKNFSGNYRIGGTGTTPAPGCDYVDLTAAFADMTGGTLTGAVSLILTADYNAAEENSFPLVFNEMTGAGSTNTVTLKPDAGVTKSISGSGTAILKINGADYFILDGSNSGTSSRNLTVSNTSTSANTAAVWVASAGTGSGAHHVTLKNCIIRAGISGSSSVKTFGIFAAGASVSSSGTGDDNDNLTIQNNLISKAYYGIYAAASSSGVNDNLVVSGDSVGSSSAGDYVIGFGIYIKYCTGASVDGNTVFNMVATGNRPTGIYVDDGVVNSTVTQNRICGLAYTGTGTSGGLGMYIGTSTSSNLVVANNLVYDISGTGSSVLGTGSMVGIHIGEPTGGIQLYYNSVNLFCSYSHAVTLDKSAAIYISTSKTGITLLNNIFRNSILNTATSATAYAIYNFWDASIWGTIDYNDYYTEGSQGVLGYQGTNKTTLAAWSAATGQDAHSIAANPVFAGTTNLKIDFSSPARNAATPVSITTDFENVTRNAITPTMGAYETAVDVLGPYIVYTPLPKTSSISARTLIADITDLTGVPTSGSGLPVLYWKIDAGSWNNTQGTYLSGSQYQFSFGSGVATGNTVYYYIAAQDICTPPNVSVSPSAGASGFSSSPPACSAPPTSPSSYLIVEGLSGTKTVGSGGDYANLTGNSGLFKKINDNVLTGNLTVQVISALTEEGTNALNQWMEEGGSNFTLTIQPNNTTERLISGTVANAMIRLDGADRVTIDGHYSGSGRYLRFRNTNASNATIQLLNAATFNTIQYCFVEGASTAGTNGTIFFSTSNQATGNTNNSVLYNIIRDRSDASGIPTIAVYSSGTTGKTNGSNTISNNDIYNFSQYGVLIQNTGNGNSWTINNNSFYNNQSPASSTLQRGIYLGAGSSTGNHTVSGNYVGGQAAMCGGSSWVNNSSSSFYGILVSVGNSPPSTVSNNTVQNITMSQSGARDFVGILYDGYVNVSGNVVGHPSDQAKSLRTAAQGYSFIGIKASSSSYFFSTIENNQVYNLVLTGTQYYPEVSGIYLFTADVRKNILKDIGHCTSAGISPVIYGIYINGTSGATNEISNNVISIDGGNSADPWIYGIFDYSYSNCAYDIWYNSVSITGPSTSSSFTQAFYTGSGATLTMENNIFGNFRGTGGGGINYGMYFEYYNVFTSDYNDIFCPDGIFGYYNYYDINSFADWKNATGQDSHSSGNDPLYVNTISDLHPGLGSPALYGGTPLVDVLTDIENATRSVTNPTIGAYENTNETGKTWNGSISSDWSNASNWTPSGIPTASDNLVIPSGTPNSCILSSAGLVCKHITLYSGATVTINSGSDVTVNGNLTIQNNANLVNSGNVKMIGNLQTMN